MTSLTDPVPAMQHIARSDWLIAVCSVVFDLDVGQQIESVCPAGALSEATASAVAFHSFPDSMSLELHARSSVRDSTFFFRLRSTETKSHEASYRQHSYLYGFVFCRQRQDERLRRGGEQKSVVVLSQQPYSSALIPLAQYAGPLYFNLGRTALEEVYQEVLEWDPPIAGARCMLEFGDTTLITQVAEPSTLPPPASVNLQDQYADLQLMQSASEDVDNLHAAFHEVDVYLPFSALLQHLWTLWEMVVLAEPLLVLAPSPGECSTAVAALIALISPLPYSADFRPYFTIHDPDYQTMTAPEPSIETTGHLPRLLGVTNRYFLKALPQWPNTVSVGTRPPPAVGPHQPPRGSRMGRAMAAVRQRTLGGQPQLGDHVQALWAAYKPLTRPDQHLLDRLVKPAATDSSIKTARTATVNSQAIRKHFVQLTNALLTPFSPWYRPQGLDCHQSPAPGQQPPALGQQPPAQGQQPHALPAFSHIDFIAHLQSSQLPLVLLQRFKSQAACVQFYKRFIECPNFMAWFERRRAAAAAWQEEMLSTTADVHQVAAALNSSKGEAALEPSLSDVQLVEAFFELEGRLEAALAAASHPAAPPEVAAEAHALKQQLNAIFENMPRDLQQTMLSSPHRAALLQTPGPRLKVPGQPQRQTSSSSL